MFRPIATAETRLEILVRLRRGEALCITWLKILYGVGGSLKRLKQAKTLLWEGQVDDTQALFADCSLEQARRFCDYLERHRHRIVNYSYFQAEQICSIGSGAVESAIKQIDHHMKLPGAQWVPDNVRRARISSSESV